MIKAEHPMGYSKGALLGVRWGDFTVDTSITSYEPSSFQKLWRIHYRYEVKIQKKSFFKFFFGSFSKMTKIQLFLNLSEIELAIIFGSELGTHVPQVQENNVTFNDSMCISQNFL